MTTSKKKEFKRIPIQYVIDRDLKDLTRRRNMGDNFYMDCPFCGGKLKMNVNTRRDFFRCNRCSEGGNSLRLHAKLKNESLSESYKVLVNELYVEGKCNDKYSNVVIVKETDNTLKLDSRHYVNYSLLQALKIVSGLQSEHLADLKRRGLSDEYIANRRYMSFGGLSEDKYNFLQSVFIEKLLKICCWQRIKPMGKVPGLYGDMSNKDSMYKIVHRKKSGYLIPIRTLDDRISGFQIRHFQGEGDDSETFQKYTWLSSSEKEEGVGVRNIDQIHHVGFVTESGLHVPKEVGLTEGALKADVASYLSGQPFIALIGVNNTSQLKRSLIELKRHGCECIRLCVDMDYRSNPYVKKAMEKIEAIIKSTGLKLKRISWNPAYKGIDDYLLARKVSTTV